MEAFAEKWFTPRALIGINRCKTNVQVISIRDAVDESGDKLCHLALFRKKDSYR